MGRKPMTGDDAISLLDDPASLLLVLDELRRRGYYTINCRDLCQVRTCDECERAYRATRDRLRRADKGDWKI